MQLVSKWLIFIGILYFQVACTNKATNDNPGQFNYLSEDPETGIGSKYASSVPFQFESGQNKLTARILLAQNHDPMPTVIFLNGNPGFERNEDIGHALTRNGFNSLFFFYTGSWGNAGIFSFSQCINDTENLLTYIVEKRNQFRIDTSQIYLIGYSTGADIGLLAAQNTQTQLKGIMCIDPWHGYAWLKSKNENSLNQYKEALKVRPAVNITDGNKFVNEIIKNKSYNLQNLKWESFPPIFYIFSSNYQQSYFTSSINKKLDSNSLVLNAADHSFSNKRIALTKTVNNWLISNKTK